jgi:putative spermidine/putrescine transport system permease protein
VTKESQTRVGYWVLLTPALLLGVAFYAAPLARVLWLSVTEPSVGLSNYALLFTSASIQRTLATTVRISLLSTVLTLLFAYPVAYVITHSADSARRWMMYFVLFPLWISVLVRAFAWTVLLRTEGLVNNSLLASGIIAEPLALLRNETGVVIGMVHYLLPFAVLILFANMRGLDKRLMLAARGLGATPRYAFVKIFLPLTVSGIASAGLFVFIFSIGFYVTPTILGGGRVLMIAEYIAIQLNETLRWGLATMLASVLTFATLLIVFVMSRFTKVGTLWARG